MPSDREIPKTLTDGQPIVLADARSEAAGAFRTLADLYAKAVSRNGAPIQASNSEPERRDVLKNLLGRR